MKLQIISAQEVLYSGTVTSVALPGTMGEFTVLRNHASLLATLTAGKIRYTDDGGNMLESDITGGIVDVDNNVISVCVY
ncbi:MAG: F0F1 ATP synthase subunit epsilon [Muribaculaceae bacterium]|nr:F0F1 ATP synthase subunit epsilon [Muribaculaceae bacterium]MDE6197930.1 F0F1 ATP synthase subunit epsilon [Muribaculaceae bacterium]